MYDFHVNFGEKTSRPDMDVVRKLRDVVNVLKSGQNRKCVFFIATETVIPPALQKEIVVYEFPLPKLDDIKRKLQAFCDELSEEYTGNTQEETYNKIKD